jgi:hypothetical protein
MSAFGIDESHWTPEEDQLLLELLHVSKPGGLNDKVKLTWQQIATNMTEMAPGRGISDRTYTLAGVMARYHLYIRKAMREQAGAEIDNSSVGS